jgi:ribonuclease HII
MDTDYPGYGFAEHKGYSTAAHSAALNELGPCSEHRHSFINVRRVASGSGTRIVAECQPGDDAGQPGDDADPPGAPNRQAQNRWGKMEPRNQPRYGEGRLSR